jgi:hypothetical protein
MTKVKTFTTEIKVFHTIRELSEIDNEVNKFLAGNNVKRLISISDTCTTDDNGATIGLIMTVAYEEV